MTDQNESADGINAAFAQITVHEALESVSRMLCAQLGEEWISGLSLKEQWALRPQTNDPSSPIRVLNAADFQPSPELIAQAREKRGWRAEQRQWALNWLCNNGLLPTTTGYLSPTRSTFIDRAAFERIFESEFGEQYRNCERAEAWRSPHSTEPDAAAQPSTAASEPPQDDGAAIKRTGTAKKTMSLKTYSNYQRETRETTGYFASRATEESWAKKDGYSVESVRAARGQFRNKLPPAERAEFEKKGRRPAKKPAS